MALLTRILLLTALSASGIALLAPLAARSAADPAPEVELADRLLPPARVPELTGDRGGLSSRLASVDGTGADPERLEGDPLPTPGTAPMEATLHSAAQPAPAAATPPRTVTYSGDSVWDDLARCESGGNWAINTGNGYYGGLQFSYGTWHNYGGGEFAEYPHQATREEQIIVAERLRDARGYAPWPACRAKLGLP
jgi:hypothetical protein